jgi:peptide/nickel transport system permease protein
MATPIPALDAGGFSATQRRVRRFALARRVASDPALLLGLSMCALLLVAVVLGPFAGTHDSQAMTPNVLQPPSDAHVLGTDSVGRDVLARLLLGARASLAVAAVATTIALAIGVAMGLASAYLGGAVDWMLMRFIDIVLSVPPLLVAIAVLAAIGPSIPTLLLVLVVTHLPQTVRLLRSAALQVRQRAFVDSARISRIGRVRIMWSHILPNVRGIVIVQASIMVAHMLLVETILSFLGLGVQPPNPSLGFMVSEGRQWMELAPWVVLAPGSLIVFAVAAFTIAGHGLDRMLASRS